MDSSYSGYYPDQETIRSFVSELKKDTRDAITPFNNSIATIHNAFTDYIISLMSFGTGHRPVTDPFCHLADIDLTNSWCLVDDKVMTENRRFRPCALPPLVKEQLEAYLKHLKNLAMILMQRRGSQEQVGASIYQLFTKSRTQNIPLFFYLKEDLSGTTSINRQKIQQLWEKYWEWPANFGRRFIATELQHNNVSAHLVRIQLGHAESVDYPLGRSSTTIPLTALEHIGRKLDPILKSFGWEVISIKSTRKKSLTVKHTGKNARYDVHECAKFGPEQRYEERKKRLKFDKELVESCITKVFPDGIPKKPKREDIDQLIDTVREEASANKAQVSRCLFFLYRKLRRLRLQGNEIKSYRQVIAIPEEGSPFKRNTAINYQLLQITQQRFIRHLANAYKENKKIDFETRLAEISVCAVLFGRIATKEHLQELPHAILSDTFKLGDLTFIDFRRQRNSPDTDDHGQIDIRKHPDFTPPDYRWYPDELSLALILGLYRLFKTHTNWDKRLFNKKRSELLKSILPPSAKANDRLRLLTNMAHAGAVLELPGFIRTYVLGERPHTPMPLSAQVRLITGLQLIPEYPILQYPPPSSSAWLPNIEFSREKNSKTIATSFLKGFRKEFSQARKLAFKNNEGRDRKLRLALASKIPNFMEQNNWPTVASAIAAWVHKLCKKGTELKANLAFNTVDSYAFMVGTPLVEEQYKLNFLSLSEEEYEDIYLRALTYANREDVLNVLGRIREFHQFLVDNWDIEEPDWSAVYLEAGELDQKEPFRADSSFLTEKEYEHALDLCLGLSKHPTLLQCQRAALIILGYRFGLRFGECYKSQLRDIQILDNDWSLVYFITRNSIYGKIKTLAGTRHIPLVSPFSQREIRVLEKVMAAAEDRGREKGDIQTALMAQGNNPRDLIDRFELSRYVNVVLKKVTGDPRMRFHHLRRSWYMKLVATACQNNKSDSWSAFYNLICPTQIEYPELVWGGYESDCKRLEDTSRIVGHVDTETSLVSYTHFLDILTHSFSSILKFKITNYTWAYTLGTTENAIKKRLIKYGRSFSAMIKPDVNEKLIPTPEITAAEFSLERCQVEENHDKQSMSFLDVENILSAIKRRLGDTKGSAERYGIEDNDFIQLIESAAQVEIDSGYEAYQVYLVTQPELVNEDDKEAHKKINLSEANRARTFLQNLQPMEDWSEEKLNAISALTSLWRFGYYPYLNYLYLPDPDAVEILNKGFEFINMSGLHFEFILTNPDTPPENVKKKLDSKKFTVSKKEELSPRGLKPGIQRRTQVGMRITNLSETIATMKTVDRILFILSCYIEWKKSIQDN